VLIVDDEREIVELLQELLVGAGYDVRLAAPTPLPPPRFVPTWCCWT
jgi:CheY-like chemotaxis protein